MTTPATRPTGLGDRKLAAVLSGFARTLLLDGSIETILQSLVDGVTMLVPAMSAGVALVSRNTMGPDMAASDEHARRYERLQIEVDEGPGRLAHAVGRPVRVADLAADRRFPVFGSRAAETGLAAMFAFPLIYGSHRLGTLDLFRQEVGPLAPAAQATVQTLADVIAAYVVNAQTRNSLRQESADSHEAAFRDRLTGLPDRRLLLDRLGAVLAGHRRRNSLAAVLFVDLDHFKTVNDTYGHLIGDQLLVAVADRLRKLIRPGDMAGRLSGDEFVVVCDGLSGPDQATAIGQRMVAALAAPYRLEAIELRVTASVGLALANGGGERPEQILHEADTAMYRAKRLGGFRQQIFVLEPSAETTGS